MKNSSKYNNNLNVVGKVLKEKRLGANLSFEKLSNKLMLLGINIPDSSLFRIENNQRTVRDYEICALAVALNTDVTELLYPFVRKLK